VAQGEGPEFKPQYQKKKKQKWNDFQVGTSNNEEITYNSWYFKRMPLILVKITLTLEVFQHFQCPKLYVIWGILKFIFLRKLFTDVNIFLESRWTQNITKHIKILFVMTVMADTCNPNYSVGRHWENGCSGLA
jgi:hypothetical protein